MKNALLLLLLAISVASCSSLQVFHMEVLMPAYVMAPPGMDRVLIADHSCAQPDYLGHKLMIRNVVVGDTTFCTDSLSEKIVESIVFYLGKADFYHSFEVLHRDSVYKKSDDEMDCVRSVPLTSEERGVLTKGQDADLLFSLDRVLVQTVTNVHPYGTLFRSTRDVRVNTVWRVYDIKADTLISQFQYSDSLYWERFGQNVRRALAQLPEPASTIGEIGDVVAENISKCLGPYWEKVKWEYYTTGSYRMKIAADLVHNESMKEAAALWQIQYKKGRGKSVFRAAVNMMMSEVFFGRPLEALNWGIRAKSYVAEHPSYASEYDRQLLKFYMEEIQTRLMEQEKLKIYFGGNLN
jgi:hypothetical protein